MSDGPTRVCTGPAHHGPTRVPLDEQHWHFHRSGVMAGKPLSRCKLCVNWHKLVGKDGPHGLTPIGRRFTGLANELLQRCGSYESVLQAHGIRQSTLAPIVRGERTRIQKKTAARILLALSEQRKYDRRNGTTARFMAARVHQARSEIRMEELAGY